MISECDNQFLHQRKCQIEKSIRTYFPNETEVPLPNENTHSISSTQEISQPSPSDSPPKTPINCDENTQRIVKDTNVCSSTDKSSNVPIYALPEKLKPKVSACIQLRNKLEFTIIFISHICINLIRVIQKILVHVCLTKMSLVIY